MKNNIIRKDLYRYIGETSIIKGFRHTGFQYTYFMRKAKKGGFLKILYKLALRYFSHRYHYQIPPNTKIGEGLYLGHFGKIIINPRCVIGKNCNIMAGVTIGQANRGRRKGCPTIGDMVWIGANAVVVGKVTIGNNVMIAPNAFVNFDVPSDSVVYAERATSVSNKKATEGYISFIDN